MGEAHPSRFRASLEKMNAVIQSATAEMDEQTKAGEMYCCYVLSDLRASDTCVGHGH